MHLTLPPLRERHGDSARLAAHFLRAYAERFGRGEKTLHSETIAWFDRYSWPGNIRELENLIYREYLLADEVTISIAPLTWQPLNVDAESIDAAPLRLFKFHRCQKLRNSKF